MPSPPNGFTGRVLGGSGSTYQVLLNTGLTVSATVTFIDPAETVPAGTYAIVVQLPAGTGGYFFQPPVFAPDS